MLSTLAKEEMARVAQVSETGSWGKIHPAKHNTANPEIRQRKPNSTILANLKQTFIIILNTA